MKQIKFLSILQVFKFVHEKSEKIANMLYFHVNLQLY